jgi:AraC-like DNA-binding protein
VYDPGIIIIGQGRKRGYLGDQVYTYDAHNYLVLSVPLPLECETEASPEEPLLGMIVLVTPAMLGELLVEMDGQVTVSREIPRGISAMPLTDDLTDAVVRLLECMKSPADSRILGNQNVREIVYRVLLGEQGGALQALATQYSHFSLIAGSLARIHADYADPLDLKAMAREAGMSVSTFYHRFRAVTSTSPLQYLKSIRLHKARTLMVQEGVNASTAAEQVGYESPSQFSREFKRLFGKSPIDEAAAMRARLSLSPGEFSRQV